ncbi:unnamed protein product [Caenorhabditis brenneri]
MPKDINKCHPINQTKDQSTVSRSSDSKRNHVNVKLKVGSGHEQQSSQKDSNIQRSSMRKTRIQSIRSRRRFTCKKSSEGSSQAISKIVKHSSWFPKSHSNIGHPRDKVKEMSHHQLNSQQDKPVKVEDHATTSRHIKAAKDQFRLPEISHQRATRGFVENYNDSWSSQAVQESQGPSTKLKLRITGQLKGRTMTEVQKQEANAHPLDGPLRSPRLPTSCQDKLKQTRRYQTIHNISQLVLRSGAEATVINTCKDSMQTTKSPEEFRKPLGIQLDMRIHRQRSLAEEQVTQSRTSAKADQGYRVNSLYKPSQRKIQKCIVKDEDNLEEFVSKKGSSSQLLSGVNRDEVDQKDQ